MTLKILHFSDFHLDGRNIKGAREIIDSMLQAVSPLTSIDLIIFTGDMINQGGAGYKSIEEAFRGFEELVICPLCDTLKLGKERFIFAPGNHDIKRDEDDEAIELFMEKQTTSIEDVVATLRDSKTENRTKRINNVKEFEKNHYSFLDSNHYSYSRYDSHFIIEINGIKVGVSSLNTVWRCGFDDENKIVMGLSQIQNAVHFLKDCDFKIAATHYRYDKLKEFERDELKNLLATYYNLFLSGHTHSSYITFLPNDKGKVALDVNTAGALTLNEFTKHDKHKNAFQIITYYTEDKFEVCEYKMFDGISFTLNSQKGENGVATYNLPSRNEALQIAQMQAEAAKEIEFKSFKQSILPFKTLKESRQSIKAELFAVEFEDCNETLIIKKELQSEENRNIRLMALSGMGKTRIVFDLFESVDNVYYTPISKCEAGLNALLSKIQEGTVIIDNCSIDDLRILQSIIDNHKSNVKVITIHNVLIPKEERIDGKVLVLKYDDTEEIVDKLIARETVLDGKDNIKALIKERSGNIPYMAILMIDAYKRNGNLQIENKNQVLSLLLKGHGDISGNNEKSLKALSLFEPLGCENSVIDEYEYVTHSNKVHHINENQNVVDGIFCDTINDYSSRQLIETSGSCMRIRPKPLAEWLTESWLDEHGYSLGDVYNEIAELEEGLSKRLARALGNRIIELTRSKSAKEIFDQKNNPIDGSFHDERIAFSKAGSQLFLSMGIVSPVMVARNLESLLYLRSVNWLRENLEGDTRRNLVWAMENIAMNADAFGHVAKSLGRLALAENESISNNSTGQFLQLFHIFLSGTKADLKARVCVLIFFEKQGDCDDLLIKALDHALMERGFVRTNTSRYQLQDSEIEDYYPKFFEIKEYWEECLTILKRIADKNDKNLEAVNKVLSKHVSDFQHAGLLNILISALDIFASKVNYDWVEMRDALSMDLYYWFQGTSEERQVIVSWIEKLTPKSFYVRMQLFVKDTRYEEGKDWKTFEKKIEQALEPFVDEFIENRIYNTEEMGLMIRDEKFNIHWFVSLLAQKLSSMDTTNIFTAIQGIIHNEDKTFESSFVTILSSIIPDKTPVEALLKTLYAEGYCRLSASLQGILDNGEHRYLMSVINDVNSGIYDNNCINNYLRYGRVDNIPSIFDIFLLMKNNGMDLYNVVYPYLFNFVFFHNIDELQTLGYLNQYKSSLIEYPFSEKYQGQAHDVIEKMMNILDKTFDPDFALAVHRITVNVIIEHRFASNPFEHIYFKLLPKYQDTILEDLLDIIAANDIRMRFFLEMYLYLGSGFGVGNGPLFQCDIERLKKACARHPAELPERLALMCPVYEYEEDKGPVGLSSFFLWLCDNYGDNERMLHEFSANMGTFSWSGFSGFSNYIEQRLQFITPLLKHSNITVRKWAELECKAIENDVKREREKEEYTKMVRG